MGGVVVVVGFGCGFLAVVEASFSPITRRGLLALLLLDTAKLVCSANSGSM